MKKPRRKSSSTRSRSRRERVPFIHAWPPRLTVPEGVEPGQIVQAHVTIRRKGYTIKRGPRRGQRVKPTSYQLLYWLRAPSVIHRHEAPAEFQSSGLRWLTVEAALKSAAEEYDADDIELQVPIYRIDEDDSFIEANTRFMWDEPLKTLSKSSIGASDIFAVRVWFLLHNESTGKYFIICRTRSIRYSAPFTRASLKAVYDYHVVDGHRDEDKHMDVPSIYAEMEEFLDGKSYEQLLRSFCWTVYIKRGVRREKFPWHRRKTKQRPRARRR